VRHYETLVMKTILYYTVLVLSLVSAQANAQKKSTKGKTTQKPKAVPTNKPTASANTLMLNSVGNYPAKANIHSLSMATNNYTISDPILTTLSARANGANIRFNNSGIVGMPKSTYGFANGHISLKTTGAVTSGTETGSGGVSTGTSLATFGSIGAPMNVNGKSPYAGINMWGNAMNMHITGRDSTVRITPARKQ
jgi:hypothetical protein